MLLNYISNILTIIGVIIILMIISVVVFTDISATGLFNAFMAYGHDK